MDHRDNEEKFHEDLLDLIETHAEIICAGCIVHQLIYKGTSFALHMSNNPLLVIKTINISINDAIELYEKDMMEEENE